MSKIEGNITGRIAGSRVVLRELREPLAEWSSPGLWLLVDVLHTRVVEGALGDRYDADNARHEIIELTGDELVSALQRLVNADACPDKPGSCLASVDTQPE